MNCPDDYVKMRVRHTRPGYLGLSIKRIYECPKCGFRWATKEIFIHKVDWSRYATYMAPINHGKGGHREGINSPGAIVINSAGNYIPTPRVGPGGIILKKQRAKTNRRKS